MGSDRPTYPTRLWGTWVDEDPDGDRRRHVSDS
jgi:hypothetical protein